MLVFICAFYILIQRVFLQIVNGQAYLDDYSLIPENKKRYREPEVVSWTLNGVVLADNKLRIFRHDWKTTVL